MDSLSRACFCLCMWTFLRGLLGDQKKPSMQVSSSGQDTDDFWISIRYSPRGVWRHFCPAERGVREMTGDTPSSSGATAVANQPHTPLNLVGVMLRRFWAQALTTAVKRSSGSTARQSSSGFCSKWLSLVLEFDRDKGLGLSESLAFVSCIRSGLEQGRIADRCLPDLIALVARHAEERAEVPVSPFRTSGPTGSTREKKELWAVYEALSTLVSMSGGAAGGPGSGGGGMPTHTVVRAADHVGQSADVVMSRAHAALRRSPH